MIVRDESQCSTCPGRVICRCLQVTEETLLEALATGEIGTVRDVRDATGAGEGCTACHRTIARYIERHCSSALPICSAR